jgi:hypothetical protein
MSEIICPYKGKSEIICPYKGKCTSEPNLCYSCSNNTGKRNYYSPQLYPYWQPSQPPNIIWCTTGSATGNYYTQQ